MFRKSKKQIHFLRENIVSAKKLKKRRRNYKNSIVFYSNVFLDCWKMWINHNTRFRQMTFIHSSFWLDSKISIFAKDAGNFYNLKRRKTHFPAFALTTFFIDADIIFNVSLKSRTAKSGLTISIPNSLIFNNNIKAYRLK